MAYNGSGIFSRLYSWAADAAGSIAISSSRVDAEIDGMATGLSTCITKDGQQTTTAAIPLAAGVTLNDGSAATPSYTFTADTNTGFYRIGADNIGIATNGAKVLDIGTGGLGVAVDGSTASPSIAFSSETNTGFYRKSAGVLAAAVGGVDALLINSTGITINGWSIVEVINITSPSAAVDIPIPASAKCLRLSGYVDANGSGLAARTSVDGGVTFSSGSTDYSFINMNTNSSSGTFATSFGSANAMVLSAGQSASVPILFQATLSIGSATLLPSCSSQWTTVNSGPLYVGQASSLRSAAAAINSFRILGSAGNITTARILVEAM